MQAPWSTPDIPPPVLEAGSEFDLRKDARYAGIAIPSTESLKDTIARVLPYYERAIVPQLRAGETVIIYGIPGLEKLADTLRAWLLHQGRRDVLAVQHQTAHCGRPFDADGDGAAIDIDRLRQAESDGPDPRQHHLLQHWRQ